MEKRDKEMPYEVIVQERNKVDLYGNVVYYIYWFDRYGNDITNEWKFWSKGPKKTGNEQRKTIKLSLSINDDDNDDVFCYCNGIESFKQLAEYGMGKFIVTFCWSFF